MPTSKLHRFTTPVVRETVRPAPKPTSVTLVW
jgi:hypothetical protein